MICTNEKLHLGEELVALIKDELNVENLEVLQNADEFVSYEIKPQLRTVGPKYGKALNGIKEYLSSIDPVQAVGKVRKGENLEFDFGEQHITLSQEDLLITLKNKEGYSSETNGQITVVLDTALNEELIEKGIVKEFVSKIQNLRKESGFEVVNHIKIELDGDEKLVNMLLKYQEQIKKGTLSDIVIVGQSGESSLDFEFDYKKIKAFIERI